MIKHYIFRVMDERMYLILEEGAKEAIVIDPYEEEEAFKELEGYEKIFILLTHHHFDHISGVNALKNRFDCEVICTEACGKIICSPDNGSHRFPFLFMNDRDTFHYVRDHYELPYTCTADTVFSGEMKLEAAGHDFYLMEMPGHSISCMMIMMDGKYLFTGDNVLGNGRELAFPDACKEEYKSIVMPYLKSLECTDVKIMPGHGDENTVEYFLKLIREYI